MEVDAMRELSATEMEFVSGAGDECSGNDIGGVTDSEGLAQDLINIYEAVVQATSYVIERVADALKG